MNPTPTLADLLTLLHQHLQTGRPVVHPSYQAHAAQFVQAVHGFGLGDVVDIRDADGATDNMPMVVETLELVELGAAQDPAKTAIRIRGPIFCNNAQFDGSAGEGTCRPLLGDAFIRLN